MDAVRAARMTPKDFCFRLSHPLPTFSAHIAQSFDRNMGRKEREKKKRTQDIQIASMMYYDISRSVSVALYATTASAPPWMTGVDDALLALQLGRATEGLIAAGELTGLCWDDATALKRFVVGVERNFDDTCRSIFIRGATVSHLQVRKMLNWYRPSSTLPSLSCSHQE